MLRDSTPRFVGPSVRRYVGPSVHPSVRHTLLFLGFCGFWPHCSCPNDGVTSIMAPAHPHATGVAVYPALFFLSLLLLNKYFVIQPNLSCGVQVYRRHNSALQYFFLFFHQILALTRPKLARTNTDISHEFTSPILL